MTYETNIRHIEAWTSKVLERENDTHRLDQLVGYWVCEY